jgi:hypothetical protein
MYFVFMLLNSEKGVAVNIMSQIQSIIMNAFRDDTSLAFCGNGMLPFL